jgi:hypothetical protein
VVSALQIFRRKCCTYFSSSNACHMSHPSHLCLDSGEGKRIKLWCTCENEKVFRSKWGTQVFILQITNMRRTKATSSADTMLVRRACHLTMCSVTTPQVMYTWWKHLVMFTMVAPSSRNYTFIDCVIIISILYRTHGTV